jgi:hypothetical protein
LAAILWYSATQTIKTFSADDPNRPVAALSQSIFDFGEMKLSEVRDHDFSLKNTGKSDLVLTQIVTSCDCTFAQIISPDGTKSPEFSMQNNSDWQTKVKPDQSVTLKITYKPALMPVSGPVKRVVDLATNDPANPKLEVTITAKVSS